MSDRSGSFDMQVPHICGEKIDVTVTWWYTHGSYFEPPDGDLDFDHIRHCPKCGMDLHHDTIFELTMNVMEENAGERGEDPGEPEDLEEPEPEWDDDMRILGLPIEDPSTHEPPEK